MCYYGKGPYAEAAAALAGALRDAGHSPQLNELNEQVPESVRALLERLRAAPPGVIATSGPTLTAEVLDGVPGLPVVFFMVPNARGAPFLAVGSPHVGRVAGVASDVAPADQLGWLRRVTPDCRSVALLVSERSRGTAMDLVAAGRSVGIDVVLVNARQDGFAEALEELNRRRLGVLMLPDSQVYNSANVQGLLVWGLRNKHPVHAFSDKVVRAGALSGIYSDPADVGREAADVVNQIIQGAPPAKVGLRYPRSPRRGVNLHTAELLGVDLTPVASDRDLERFGQQK